MNHTEGDLRHIVWLILDVHSQACHALLHATRGERGSAYNRDVRRTEGPRTTVHALFVAQEELLRWINPLHEVLLLSLIAFADMRDCEVRLVGTPTLPAVSFMCALLGFLRDDDEGVLTRPPARLFAQRGKRPRTSGTSSRASNS